MKSIITTLTLFTSVALAQEQKQPNILFIFSDDHALNAISAYGGPLAKIAPTPHIDSLAKEGAIFQNSFCANSICGPSRACILSGKHSHKNGFMKNHGGGKFDGSQWTFPKAMQKAGYQTAVIGKWHLISKPTGFDYWEILPGQGSYYNPDFIQMDGKGKRFQGYATDITTDKAIKWLDGRDKSKPFVLMCQHKAPHRTFAPALRHLKTWEGQDIPEPETLFDDFSGRSKALHNHAMGIDRHFWWQYDAKIRKEEMGDTKLPQAPLGGAVEYNRMSDEQKKEWDAHFGPKNKAFLADVEAGKLSHQDIVRWKYQRYMKNYLGTVQAVDDSVGKLKKYLKDNGLEENTIVIYSSDQGFYLGEHGWFDKRWMFEESFKMPFLIKWPNVIKPGSKPKAMIQNIDYAPTFLDMAGLEAPQEVQGKSIVPILKDSSKKVRDSVYYAYYETTVHSVPQHFGVRNDRYKLFFLPDYDEWQMFDLEKDPQEMKSIYGDPAYAEVQKEMHAEFEKLRKEFDAPAFQKTTFKKQKLTKKLNLLPYPQSVIQPGGEISLPNPTLLFFDPRLEQQAKLLEIQLEQKSGVDVKLVEEENFERGNYPTQVIHFDALDKGVKVDSPEGYSLAIDKGVKLIGNTPVASQLGAQSLLQLVEGNKIPKVVIKDSPRFNYRGYMVDCSRHFWEVEQLKQFIDILSHYKFNTLHLHLTDSAAWRLEIKKYPKLTTIGSKGNHLDKNAPNKFYTQEQIKELIAYAKVRGIQIVPEIDMPGHAAAALRAYPEHGVGGKGGNTFNPSNPATVTFLKDILTETAALFESPYIHMGGDEVGKGNWEKDPFIAKQMKELGTTKAIDIEHHFVKVITEHIESLGKIPVGWDEINEGGSASKKSVIMCWRGDGGKHAKHAIETGNQILMTPQLPVYFDWSYGANSTSKVYNWDPTFFTEKRKDLVLGVQANLWTEQVPNIEKFYGMTFPRGLALAETAWTQPKNKDWKRFYPSLKNHLKQFDAQGISYYDEQGQDEKDFDPKNDKPNLNRPCKLTTNIPARYNLKFAFDGRKKSYFWSGRGPRKDDFILLELNEPADVTEINVWTGDLGKDSLQNGILEVSYDKKNYHKVADFKDGNVSHKFDKKTTVRGVKIICTKNQGPWLTVKEIELK